MDLIVTHNNADFDELEPYPKTKKVLNELKEKGLKLFLVTQGSERQQDKKVDGLGIRHFFEDIFLSKDGEKE